MVGSPKITQEQPASPLLRDSLSHSELSPRHRDHSLQDQTNTPEVARKPESSLAVEPAPSLSNAQLDSSLTRSLTREVSRDAAVADASISIEHETHKKLDRQRAEQLAFERLRSSTTTTPAGAASVSTSQATSTKVSVTQSTSTSVVATDVTKRLDFFRLGQRATKVGTSILDRIGNAILSMLRAFFRLLGRLVGIKAAPITRKIVVPKASSETEKAQREKTMGGKSSSKEAKTQGRYFPKRSL